MTDLPDESLLSRIDRLSTTRFSGSAWRHTTAKRDPLSGAGARLSGGRWNPKGLFPTVYLALPLRCCLAEFERIAESQAATVDDLLRAPRRLHEVFLEDVQLLDLRSEAQLEAAGLELADVESPDWTPCEQVGHAAWFLGLDGLIAPSASGQGQVLALFEQRMSSGQMHVQRSVDLTREVYDQGRDGSTLPD